jgi:ACR3 family arsenite efflux pump ArsB
MPAEKELSLLDKIQPLLLIFSIGVGLTIAKIVPELAKHLVPMVTIGVFLVIYLIMLGISLGGILNAFRRIKPTVLAIAINFIFTPLYAWFLGYLFLQGHPDIWVGLILYLVTPCIGWYLIFTELAKGDVELGVALLAWNVFLQIALLPVYMYFLAGRIVPVDVWRILQSIGIFLAAPLLLSELTKKFMSLKKLDINIFSNKLPYAKTVILMVVIISMFASQGNVLFVNPQVVFLMILPGLVFFFSIFGVVLLVSYVFRLSYPETALLVFTTAARNSEASLAIAVSAFSAPLVALTVVVGPSIELPVLIILVRILLYLREKYYLKQIRR